jgi:hypothetical protein
MDARHRNIPSSASIVGGGEYVEPEYPDYARKPGFGPIISLSIVPDQGVRQVVAAYYL